ncbi:MAG TPA: FecR domain-containing protein [Novosphingobium sp.]|nr:FecR domain-containing protein [Novosphingobium sp.]
MTTTGYLQDQEDEDAALWVARHMGGVVDANAFAQWLAGAPGRRAKFDALLATCMDDAVVDGMRLYEQRERARAATRPDRRFAIGALAAAACLAVVAFSWPQLRSGLTPAQTYATAAGEVRDVTLADGTTVTMNGATRISARIDEHRREIALKAGEALFDVRHDEARPFTVAAGSGQVTVLGTRFDLALNDDRVDLAVDRGLVRFEKSGDASSPVLVRAAHRSQLVDGRVAAPSTLAGAAGNDWRGGWLQVSDMPIGQLVPRLQRWTSLKIVVEDQFLLDKRVAGRFRLSDPAVVLDNLGVLYGFKVRRTDQALTLARR